MRKIEFKIVKKFLPVDWASQISDKIGFSVRYVRMVSKDDRKNDDIDAEIIRMAKKGKLEVDQKLEQKKKDLNSFKALQTL